MNTTGNTYIIHNNIYYTHLYILSHSFNHLDIFISQQDMSSTLSTLPSFTTSGEGIQLLKEKGASLNVDIHVSQISELRYVS